MTQEALNHGTGDDSRQKEGALGGVEAGDFCHPTAAIAVLQGQNVREGPVEGEGNAGYLLVELIGGVAYDSPARANSTGNSASQAGQRVGIAAIPVWLMRL